ncbi:MAG: bacteriohemerythrin [Candidatus Cyclobacteriaceae bacterium M3_2C_046]
MNIVNWKDELYSVKVSSIDQQHKKIFEILNRLFDSMTKGESKDVLREILSELVDYSQYHFNCEENHFCKLKLYKKSAEHKNKHQEFIEKVQQFQADYLAGEKMLTMDVFSYIKDWVNSHIRGCDKQFAGLE